MRTCSDGFRDIFSGFRMDSAVFLVRRGRWGWRGFRVRNRRDIELKIGWKGGVETSPSFNFRTVVPFDILRSKPAISTSNLLAQGRNPQAEIFT